MMSESKLFLIDAHALCYRCFFAIRGLATSKGRPTNAVLGFHNTLRKILREYRPRYLAVCFDAPVKTRRAQKFAAYKIQRPSMPQDLISQISLIKELVRAYNLAMFEVGGYEADDVIATLVSETRNENLEVVIVSDDKDMYQLAGEHVRFFNSRKEEILDAPAVEAHLGFEPRRIVDFIALAGDKTDNIPGVNGIGEVTARKLIQEYASVEDIFKQIDQIQPENLRKKLEANRENAFLSRDLAVLEEKIPLQVNLASLEVKSPDQNRLLDLFKELEFKKLAEEILSEKPKDAGAARTKMQSCAAPREVEDLKEAVVKQGCFAFWLDCPERESEDSEALLPACEGVCVALDEAHAYYVPAEHLKDLKDVWGNPSVRKVTYDFKGALKSLSTAGISLREPVFDILLAAYLLSPARNSFSLDDLVWDYFKESAALKLAGDHGAGAAGFLMRLYPLLEKELKEKDLFQLLETIETPLSVVLAQMEQQGVNLDIPFLRELSKECEQKIEQLTERLYRLAGEEFNLNSPKQLSRVLFQKLNLPVIKKTKTGFSTDEGVLTVLAAQHEVPAAILEYRQLAKLKSTYIDALPRLVDRGTGRLHTSFNQTGTETGRLSSSRPNLQNIPIRTELGRQIRKAIIPSENEWLLLSADYSQIELRILAHLCGDENLSRAFEDGQDIHAFTASLIFDVPEQEVTAHMRDTAKRVNFGIIYGMSAFGLAKDLGIRQEEAQEFIDKYFLRYPKVKEFMESTIRRCEERGFVLTLLNRRRYLPEIQSPNIGMKQFAQRQAINTPVQGSAADLLKLAMINIRKELENGGRQTRMLITVHDEVVLETPPEELNEVTAMLREIMEHPFELSVPIKVSIKAGKNWLEMEEI